MREIGFYTLKIWELTYQLMRPPYRMENCIRFLPIKLPKAKRWDRPCGSIIAIIAGTKSETVIEILQKIPQKTRKKVTEITLDMAGNMALIAKRCFPLATQVTDRFHVQKLAAEALQEIRIKHRWQAIDLENEAIEQAKISQHPYQAEVLANGDTVKQLLARSRYYTLQKSLRLDRNTEAKG